MEKLNLKYPVIVEGKYDKIRLASIVSSTVIALGGFSFFKNEEMQALIRKYAANGVIILTDSDKAGQFIRARLKSYISGEIINLHTPAICGKERRKRVGSKDGLLGVEGIDNDILVNLLKPFETADVMPKYLTKQRLFTDGLSGGNNSSALRERLLTELGLPVTLTSSALCDAVNSMISEEKYIEALKLVKQKAQNKTVSFYSLGCRVNQYEEQAIKEMFKKRGYAVVPYGEACDACVINTCAVTSESEKKSRNIISRAKHFASKVIITGCYAEMLSKADKAVDGVFYCGGCKQKSLIPLIADGEYSSPYIHTSGYEEYGICTDNSLPAERYRAFVKIEDGCNGRCSYCIIPFLRGSSSSRSANDICDEVSRLAKAGVSEIILTGIETSDYDDIPLYELINRVSEFDGIKRIRLGSLNPNCLTEQFIGSVAANPKFCRHIHVSLQSGCNRILNLMRRPYSKEKADLALYSISKQIPDLLISADIISGFPTETEEEHRETMEFIRSHRLSHVHAFPYSERPYTDAVNIKPSVPQSIRRRRNDEIISLSCDIRNEIMDGEIGKTVTILVEKNENGFAHGHTDNFLTARIPSSAPAGSYISCLITGHDCDLLGKEL